MKTATTSVNCIFQLTDGRFSPLNTLDFHGNSALHLAAQSGQKEVAVYLLQKGVDASVKNKQGKQKK